MVRQAFFREPTTSPRISVELSSDFYGSNINRAPATSTTFTSKLTLRKEAMTQQLIRVKLWNLIVSMTPTLLYISRCKSTTKTATWETRSVKFTRCCRSQTLFWDLTEKFWIFSTLSIVMDRQRHRQRTWTMFQLHSRAKCAIFNSRRRKLWSFIWSWNIFRQLLFINAHRARKSSRLQLLSSNISAMTTSELFLILSMNLLLN